MALIWEGGIGREILAQRCEVSARTVQSFIDNYREKYPGTVRYCQRSKRYQKDERFQPTIIGDDLERYLRYCRGKQMEQDLVTTESINGHLLIDDVDCLVSPEVPQVVIEPLLVALNRKCCVKCCYKAKGGIRHLILAPHSLAFARRRYHVRALDVNKNVFLDYVLGRFQEITLLSSQPGIDAQQDDDWQKMVELTFRINPELDEAARSSLQLEWDLVTNTDTMTRRVRAALAEYVIKELEAPSIGSDTPTWILVDKESDHGAKPLS